VPGRGGENTVCPDCAALLIERYGFVVTTNRIENGTCPDCNKTIAGIGM